jgi:hypothetical protein
MKVFVANSSRTNRVEYHLSTGGKISVRAIDTVE